MPHKHAQHGFSLLELLAVVTILGIIAAMLLPRVNVSSDLAQAAADDKNIAEINSAVERYYLNTGNFPTQISDLEHIDYFPEGIPVSPVTGDPYALNARTHRVDSGGGGGK